MQIPIINGVYTDNGGDVRASYPINMVPIAGDNGISDAYMRPADGIVAFGAGGPTTPDRGGINWLNQCYRVMGPYLVKINSAGVSSTLGAVLGATTGQATLDYSFDRLAVAAGGYLYYWNGTTLTQVTDPDLGTVIDMLWVDGYFMTTDGANLVVTELADPMQINPLKYGSSEADSDPIKALVKIKNEVYALNRHTIELFDNVGGSLFPFARIEGAQIQKGTLGTHTCAAFMDTIAFLGGGRNEQPSIYVGSNSQAIRISTREIDLILRGYTEAVLAASIMEVRVTSNQELLYLHLPDQTLVYDGITSRMIKAPVWFKLMTSQSGKAIYKARNFVWCYDKWLCGDPTSSRIGELVTNVSSHWGDVVGWEVATKILYVDE